NLEKHWPPENTAPNSFSELTNCKVPDLRYQELLSKILHLGVDGGEKPESRLAHFRTRSLIRFTTERSQISSRFGNCIRMSYKSTRHCAFNFECSLSMAFVRPVRITRDPDPVFPSDR